MALKAIRVFCIISVKRIFNNQYQYTASRLAQILGFGI